MKLYTENFNEHIARLNRVIEFIDTHLNEDVNLDALADVAAYSKFHFHRIFRASMGEPLAEYIRRRRLEKAAFRLRMDNAISITDIAIEYGFSSSAVFAKNFRARFGVTPSEWRILKQNTVIQKQTKEARHQLCSIIDDENVSINYVDGTQTWTFKHADTERQVKIETISDMTLAYIMHTGPYKGDTTLFENLFSKIFSWLAMRQIHTSSSTKAIVIYHEYPEITASKQLRLSTCCTVPPGTIGGGRIGIMTFSPGLCAISRFCCASDEYQSAWDWMYETWLPNSCFLPSDYPAFERYDCNAYDKNTGKTIVDICIPILVKE